MALPAGIARVGVYLPRLRLARSTIADAVGWVNPQARTRMTGARTVCNWDEDALTMAVEAARSALQGGSAQPIASLSVASTTLPFADRDNAVLIGGALDASEQLRSSNRGASLRAGVDAVADAARQAESSLVIATDARHAQPGSAEEVSYGHGAAAFLLTTAPDEQIARIVGTDQIAADLVDHYRMAGEDFDYAFEDRWVREEGYLKLVPKAVESALSDAKLRARDIQHFVMPGTTAVAQRVAEAVGMKSARLSDNLSAATGDCGTPHALIMCALALESAKPGEHILIIGFGQGVTVLVVQVQPAIVARRPAAVSTALKRSVEEKSYVRYLSHAGLLAVDFGMRAERDNRTAQSVAYRKRRAVTAFVGGRCSACGTVQFPKSRVCVNPDCRKPDSQEEFRLAETSGRVKSFTEDWQAYSPRPPYLYGNVEFSDGGNLLMEFTDFEPGDLQVDTAVRFVFRIKDIDRLRGFQRYFWKATRA